MHFATNNTLGCDKPPFFFAWIQWERFNNGYGWMLAPFKFGEAWQNLEGKNQHVHLYHRTDDRFFFRKINKNVSCTCGPKVYGKSKVCLISKMQTIPLKIPKIDEKNQMERNPGEKFSIIWLKLVRKMLLYSQLEISGNANQNFSSMVSAQKSKAPLTGFRIFLNRQLFLSGFKFPLSYEAYSNRIHLSTRIR